MVNSWEQFRETGLLILLVVVVFLRVRNISEYYVLARSGKVEV
jgi:hypothetical protein